VALEGQDFDAILVAAQAGGEWAFSSLYREFNPKLLRYFGSRAPAEADDLAAETWIGVARQLRTFRGDETGFRAWLFTIAHRQLIQHWRKRSRRGQPEQTEGTALQEIPAPENPEAVVVEGLTAQEAARRIAAALSNEQAEVVLLRVLGGLDVDEVAKILGKRPGSIRALQHRALKKLVAQKILPEGVTQ